MKVRLGAVIWIISDRGASAVKGVFEAGDRIGLIGDREQIAAVQQLLEVSE